MIRGRLAVALWYLTRLGVACDQDRALAFKLPASRMSDPTRPSKTRSGEVNPHCHRVSGAPNPIVSSRAS